MNYYQFHIGDYAAHTRRLSHLEDLAYRRLLDEYYLQECPLIGSVQEIARLIGMADHLTDVERVLNDYFDPFENGWANKRCDEEIERFQSKLNQKIAAGKASGEARKAKQIKGSKTIAKRPLSVRSTNAELTKNQEPVTNNQEPSISKEDKSSLVGRAKQLPIDFKPTEKHQALALQLGINLDQELEQFTDHHRARGSTMKDWNAALNTWIRNANKYGSKTSKAKGGMIWTGIEKQDFKKGIKDDGTF